MVHEDPHGDDDVREGDHVRSQQVAAHGDKQRILIHLAFHSLMDRWIARTPSPWLSGARIACFNMRRRRNQMSWRWEREDTLREYKICPLVALLPRNEARWHFQQLIESTSKTSRS